MEIISLTPHPLYPRGKRLNIYCTGDAHAPEQVWAFWRRQNLLAPSGIRTADHRAPRLVTILTELSGHKLEVYFHKVRIAAAI